MNSVIQRLQKEYAALVKSSNPLFSAKPKSDANWLEWEATIVGPMGTPYENGKFKLQISFPSEYPFKPPRITFGTKIYHCNVNSKGVICLSILKDEWSPGLFIEKVLLSLISLLSDANPYDPLVGNIARQYMNDREEHDKVAREWTQKYAV